MSVAPIRIQDPAEVGRARELVADLVEPAELISHGVESPEKFNLQWLTERNWTAVPSDAAGLDFDEAVRLAEAAHELGCRECIAVVADLKIEHPVCSAHRVPLTEDAFLEVGREYDGVVPYVLLPRERYFAILVTLELDIHAGPRAFVERVIGKPVEIARREFCRACSRQWGPGRQVYEEIARRYDGFNGEG